MLAPRSCLGLHRASRGYLGGGEQLLLLCRPALLQLAPRPGLWQLRLLVPRGGEPSHITVLGEVGEGEGRVGQE